MLTRRQFRTAGVSKSAPNPLVESHPGVALKAEEPQIELLPEVMSLKYENLIKGRIHKAHKRLFNCKTLLIHSVDQ